MADLPVYFSSRLAAFFTKATNGHKTIVSASWSLDAQTLPLSGTQGTFASPTNLSGTSKALVLTTSGTNQIQLIAPIFLFKVGTASSSLPAGNPTASLSLPSASLLAGRTIQLLNIGTSASFISGSGQTGSLATLSGSRQVSAISDGSVWGLVGAANGLVITW